MIERERTKEYLEKVMQTKDVDEIEAGLYYSEKGTTRFANSIIHQNMVVEEPYLWIRAIKEKRVAGVSTKDFRKEGIEKAINKVKESLKGIAPDKEFKGLPKPPVGMRIKKSQEPPFISPEERARAVEKVVRVCKRYNLKAFGVIHNTRTSLGVANSKGIFNYGMSGVTFASVTAMDDSASGYAVEIKKDFSEIDFQELAETAAEKALRSKNPQEIEPGRYTVLLEEPAVGEMLSFLNWLEFGAKRFREKSSLLAKKIGKRITGQNITLYDDYAHRAMPGFAFDFEGYPKKSVVLIKNGIAKGVVFDSFYASLLGKKNTGHALPQPSPWGPFPLNLIMEKGKDKKEELIREIEKGILVTRFWYVRVVDPDQTLITGMTRDGTFMIEKGKIAYPIKNLRFLINIYETLSRVRKISVERKLYGEDVSFVLAPALLIDDFNFASKTEY
uniref:TldD/PmbA family protein n=1 Tax=candidate division WOR-3 bacterium TaxID=2052148 RepID=A0A7C3Z3U7_UNCW3